MQTRIIFPTDEMLMKCLISLLLAREKILQFNEMEEAGEMNDA